MTDNHVSSDVAHHGGDRPAVRCAIVTVSDTRTAATDRSGAKIQQMLLDAGHGVPSRSIVPDGPAGLQPLLQQLRGAVEIDAVLITGGTGIGPRDQTPEVVVASLDVELPGFGEQFRALSFAEIGPAAMLSRATAGRMGRQVVFLMPGSTAAVVLAMQRLILPVLPHAVGLAGADSSQVAWPPRP